MVSQLCVQPTANRGSERSFRPRNRRRAFPHRTSEAKQCVGKWQQLFTPVSKRGPNPTDTNFASACISFICLMEPLL